MTGHEDMGGLLDRQLLDSVCVRRDQRSKAEHLKTLPIHDDGFAAITKQVLSYGPDFDFGAVFYYCIP